MHKVVMPFPFSWDGITAVDLAVGDVRDFGAAAGGLVAMGWLEPGIAAADTQSQPMAPLEAAVGNPGDDEPMEMAVVKRGRKRK
jgi:hypothetical protein